MSRPDDFGFLTGWYASQCDGDWEHEFGVRLETLDNPGWRLRVDTVGTGAEGRVLPRSKADLGPDRWLWTAADGESFEASCDVRSLAELLAAFRRFASATEEDSA
ncbi:immunity 53 family protein [Amycolatopsis plumensis]|uniref:Immunity 53 family protein n=1 Tax=Amycolatopsis plumensis TaxID=236508 RepID=A0ABV5UGK7_9PSEU